MSTYSPPEVQEWLEWAGSRILAMSVGQIKPAEYKVCWPDFAPDPVLAYGYGETETRLPRPTAREIPLVDDILGLVVVIPDKIRRRIVSSRALVRPVSGRPVYGWERLGRLLHTSPYVVKKLHQKGLNEICNLGPPEKMNKIAAFLAEA